MSLGHGVWVAVIAAGLCWCWLGPGHRQCWCPGALGSHPCPTVARQLGPGPLIARGLRMRAQDTLLLARGQLGSLGKLPHPLVTLRPLPCLRTTLPSCEGVGAAGQSTLTVTRGHGPAEGALHSPETLLWPRVM